MKSKNGTGLIVGIVITVFVIIIVGVVILWGSGYFTKNKKTLDTSTGKIDRAIGSMAEFDLDVYDGASMNGEALVELINDLKNDGVVVAVGVDTLAATSAAYYNNVYDATAKNITTTGTPATISTSKADANYINPNGTFKGSVLRNANKEIVCVLFTQQ